MVLVDAVARNVDGVLSDDSTKDESFSNELLEYPQYTRPEDFMGRKVPEILLSGDHAKVDSWRLEKSIEITKERRKDMYEKYINNR
jgi:tRNA (guanine37-N1)-methyltransferase